MQGGVGGGILSQHVDAIGEVETVVILAGSINACLVKELNKELFGASPAAMLNDAPSLQD